MEIENDTFDDGFFFIFNDRFCFNPFERKISSITDDDNHREVNINAPASRCLLLLLKNRNDVISREYFLEQVWINHGVFVSLNTYYQNISILRKALKKVGLTEEFILTIPHRGLTLSQNIKIKKQNKNETDITTNVKYDRIDNTHNILSTDKNDKKTQEFPHLSEKTTIKLAKKSCEKLRRLLSMIAIATTISLIMILLNNHLLTQSRDHQNWDKNKETTCFR